MPRLPRLLVSVRNHEEARVAARAGVDIIDFKEPANGSLAPVSWTVLRESLAEVSKAAPEMAVSVACGEVTDAQTLPEVALGPIQFLKIGLAGLGGERNWVQRWSERRRQLSDSFIAHDGKSPGWIAVAYVDHEVANSPPIEEVIAASIDNGCRGVLFDTFSKRQDSLLQLLTPESLTNFSQQIQAAGLLVAAAGKVRVSDVPTLMSCGVDVIAVRSAVCEEERRERVLCPVAIANLQAALGREAQTIEFSSKAR